MGGLSDLGIGLTTLSSMRIFISSSFDACNASLSSFGIDFSDLFTSTVVRDVSNTFGVSKYVDD